MARPRTPTAILDARGAFKNHPDRKRPGEPVVREPIGDPPEFLNDLELKWWHYLVGRAPLGVLTSADHAAVMLASRLLAMSESDFEAFTKGAMDKLMKLLGQFGMTPSERSKLSIPKAREVNPFDEFH